MNWVTDTIAIGNLRDVKNTDLLKEHGIVGVLGLIDALKDTEPEELGVEEIEVVPLIDGAGNVPDHFFLALRRLEELVAYASPVLVHCHAGRSRSVIVVAAYLMKHEHLSATEAIQLIASKREIYLTPGIRELLSLPFF